MTTIDRTQGFERHWGTFQTLTPLVQSTPGSTFDHSLGNVNCQVVGTRTWKLGDANIPVVSGNSIRPKSVNPFHDLSLM